MQINSNILMQINSNILMQINSKSYSEMTSADFIADVYLNDVTPHRHILSYLFTANNFYVQS